MLGRMFRRRPSPALAISVISLFVALGGTTYAATGGTFILGKANSAGAQTSLASSAANVFRVKNTTSTGRAVTAIGGTEGVGLFATGGDVNSNTSAILGQSLTGNGLEGTTGSAIASGVYGENEGTGYGVAGRSLGSSGVGVLGDSSAGNGVQGISRGNPASGVYGEDNKASSYGVAGHSDNGVAVVGDSANGWAVQALGDATQSRASGGFVKAMALIHPYDGILRCFNSQVSPAQATSGTCGMTSTRLSTGTYEVDFGFPVGDRFVSVTPSDNLLTFSVSHFANTPPNAEIVTFVDNHLTLQDASFYIFVY